jgi:hypothetical protein
MGASRQEFKPVAMSGTAALSDRSKKDGINRATEIATEDMGVADFKVHPKYGVENVRYKDAPKWTGLDANMAQAMAVNRQDRINFGTGLEVLQHNLKTGVQPDLIEASKRRSARVW